MTTIILGNGFDLDLGLPTRYIDFIKSPFFRPVKENESNCSLLYEFDNIKCDLKWISIEEILKDYVKRITDNPNKDDLFDDPKLDKQGFCILKKSLACYIRNIDYSAIDINSCASIFFKTILSISKGQDINVYDFNYTDLQKIAKQLSCSYLNNIIQIHGTAKLDNIILGCDDNVFMKDYQYMIKSMDENFYHNNLSIDLVKSETVIIFGHSLGSTDIQYFKDFINLVVNSDKKKKLFFITYNESSFEDVKSNIRVICGNIDNFYNNIGQLSTYYTNKRSINKFSQFLDSIKIIE
jgi:hypothetical protein